MSEIDNKRKYRIESGLEELTEAEVAEGWHCCLEWDDMLIKPGDDEYGLGPCCRK